MQRQRDWRYVGSRLPEPRGNPPNTALEFAVAIGLYVATGLCATAVVVVGLCAAVAVAPWWLS